MHRASLWWLTERKPWSSWNSHLVAQDSTVNSPTGRLEAAFLSWPSPMDFPGNSAVKILLQRRRLEFSPWVRKNPWERNDNPLQGSCLEILWTEEPRRLQSMWLQKESDTTLQQPRKYIISFSLCAIGQNHHRSIWIQVELRHHL